MDPELEKRMVELQEQAKTVINLAVDGQVIGLILSLIHISWATSALAF